MPEFVHLHVHTEYSLLDGHSRIRPLLRRTAELGMRALAITDHGALHGAIEFYREALDAGIQPILGMEAYMAPRRYTDRDPGLDAHSYHLTLLARDDEGYRNLVRLATRAHLEGFYHRPRIDTELLAAHSRGLIGLSGCLHGEVCQRILSGDPRGALEAAARLRDALEPGQFFIELQDNGLPEQKRLIPELLRIAEALGVPTVATNDVHYVMPEDAPAQDALLCVQTGKTLRDTDRPRLGTREFYLKSPHEMAALFGEIPEALRSTVEIAGRCRLHIELGRPKLPDFPVPEGFSPQSYLRHLCEQGLRRIYGRITPELSERLDYELGVIERMGYAPYFLIVQDFVNFARSRGILTTVRGSAAGSLVLYACGVTDVDPIAHRLPFDRFLNLERYTLPDIDVDFMDTRRDEVIRYVMDKYGHDRVAQIITFGTMKARQAVRDVGRVLGMSYGEVDRIAKRIPPTSTLDQALEADPELRRMTEEDGRVRRLVELARKLEGVTRNAGTHAAGVVISHDPLDGVIPLTRGKDGAVTTQYDMDSLAALGLIKFDFLGLTNLTILDHAVRLVERRKGVRIDLRNLPLDDPRTYRLLSRGETVGVFQLESEGMRRFLVELRPSSIQDIMAMVALYRPGPMANIPAYIRRKHGLEPVTYLHPVLESALRETYGVMVYQEDIMTVAQAMAGYTLAEADVLCYAIRKKVRDKLLAQREKFERGALERGIPREVVDRVFEQFEPFARYGFNRAHAACYGLIAYQTAYMKANYPAEYMTAVLCADSGDLDRVALDVAECRRMGISVLPPDINQSDADFTVIDDHTIRFGLGAIKNLGQAAVEQILQARRRAGPFRSLADLRARTGSRALTRKALESLIRAGALDSLGNRQAMLEELDSPAPRNGAHIQTSLFDQSPAGTRERAQTAGPADQARLLVWEREALGMFVSGHPVLLLGDRVRGAGSAADLRNAPEGAHLRVAGVVTEIRSYPPREDRPPVSVITLDTPTGSVQAVIPGNAGVAPWDVAVASGRCDHRETGTRLLADRVEVVATLRQPDTDTHREEDGPELHVRVTTPDQLEQAAMLLGSSPGTAAAIVHVMTPEGEALHRYPSGVQPDTLLGSLHAALGQDAAWLEHRLTGR